MAAVINESPLASNPPDHAIYNDTPLNTRRKEIRLIEIVPGSGHEPLVCKLLCEALHRGPAYLALSYTWSTDKPFLDIKINGLNFPIRQNLYAALHQIRQPSSPVRLWADAVCINQASILERNAQIPLMREIYYGASKVLIWLGEGNEATDCAMQALRKLVTLRTDSDYVLDDLDTLLPKEMQASDFSPEKRCERRKYVRVGLNDIFTRPWWDRTWTVQELALARDCPLLMCGATSICFDCFPSTITEMGKYLAKQNMADEAADYWALSGVQSAIASGKFTSLFLIREYTQASKQLGNERMNSFLARLLSHTQHSLCTDPRDKVYGLLGIAEPEALETIGIDYNLSLLEVYTKTTMYLIIRGGFQILSMQGLWPSNAGWPSWVVDFQRPLPENYEPLIRGYDTRGSKYCPLPYRGRETLARFLPEGIFRLNAIPIDRVAETSNIWRASEPSGSLGKYSLELLDDAFRVFRQCAQPCLECASSEKKDRCCHPSYKPVNSAGSHTPLADAVCRTLIADWIDPTRTYTARPPGPTSSTHLKILRNIIYNMMDHREILLALGTSLAEWQSSISTNEFKSQAPMILERLVKASNGRMAFRTERGWIGTGPYDTRPGDMIIAVVGADVPYVIRPSGRDTDPRVRIVGECYVDGIMFAECTENPYYRGGDVDGILQLYPFDLH
ncbi:HET-domain-containing protein [Paramyrothecium foliicola]|nr:HET-domain-containing protein [Paramyrothecium foliicola]